ncbi:hypothetical protein [Escherichia coli ISC7]|uniref:Uncharacterized protein n=1 Tax=Escherichia coli ISC7 TaxID=1432555 RepID=W1F7S0_ECOLX|nr:hypothetical protein [Escherichia coli ISC7]
MTHYLARYDIQRGIDFLHSGIKISMKNYAGQKSLLDTRNENFLLN